MIEYLLFLVYATKGDSIIPFVVFFLLPALYLSITFHDNNKFLKNKKEAEDLLDAMPIEDQQKQLLSDIRIRSKRIEPFKKETK